jgi:hypothetical protein
MKAAVRVVDGHELDNFSWPPLASTQGMSAGQCVGVEHLAISDGRVTDGSMSTCVTGLCDFLNTITMGRYRAS